MDKLLLLLLFALLVGYFTYQHPARQNQDEPIVYGESRFTFQVADREIELVVIGERYGNEDCMQLKDLMYEKINAVCDAENLCVNEPKYQCKDELPENYLRMLDMQSARTHYVHVQRQSDNLRGIVLFWGLTDDESLQGCKAFMRKISSQNSAPANVQCI